MMGVIIVNDKQIVSFYLILSGFDFENRFLCWFYNQFFVVFDKLSSFHFSPKNGTYIFYLELINQNVMTPKSVPYAEDVYTDVEQLLLFLINDKEMKLL